MSGRRLASAGALLLGLAALGVAAATAIAHFPSGLSVLLCLVLAICAAWFGARRRGIARTVAVAAALLLLVGAAVLVIADRRLLEDLLVVAAVAGMLATARMAFRVHVELPRAEPPSHPVLFYNPRSGGGKAARFDLPKEARLRGIEPIELHAGDDLEQLVRRALRAAPMVWRWPEETDHRRLWR